MEPELLVKFIEGMIAEIEYVYWVYGWPKEKARKKATELVMKAAAKADNA